MRPSVAGAGVCYVSVSRRVAVGEPLGVCRAWGGRAEDGVDAAAGWRGRSNEGGGGVAALAQKCSVLRAGSGRPRACLAALL